MILTTTNSIEGYRIIDYKGIVTGISYKSPNSDKANMSFKDMFKVDKYYEMYAAGLEKIKEAAFQKLQNNAKTLKANAIVGIRIDVETIANSSITVVSITGTAVEVSK